MREAAKERRMSSVPTRLVSEQEYLARERKAEFKIEFYRGEMFAMAGATREHNLIAANVSRAIGNQLADQPCEVYQSDMKVRVAATGLYTYPDVVVGCGERSEERRVGNQRGWRMRRD